MQSDFGQETSNEPDCPIQYPYDPLDVNQLETRVLHLDDLTFQRISLQDESAPGYVAISYRWGPLTPKRPATFSNTQYMIPVSLLDMLRGLHQRGFRTVWIDALCINQSDEAEKSQQVRQMGLIYSRARSVVVWLGRGPSRGETLLNLLDTCWLPATDEDIEETRHVLKWLLNREYWTRVWIIQEIAKGRSVTVMCGNKASISWTALSVALKTLSRINRAKPPAILRRINGEVRKGMDRPHESSGPANTDRFEAIQQFRLHEQNPERLQLCLYAALWHSRMAFAKLDQDKIYGILRLSSDGKQIVPIIDYRMDPYQVLQSVIRALVDVQRYHEIILLARGSLRAMRQQPSWMFSFKALQAKQPPWVCTAIEASMGRVSRAAGAETSQSDDQKDEKALHCRSSALRIRVQMIDVVDAIAVIPAPRSGSFNESQPDDRSEPDRGSDASDGLHTDEEAQSDSEAESDCPFPSEHGTQCSKDRNRKSPDEPSFPCKPRAPGDVVLQLWSALTLGTDVRSIEEDHPYNYPNYGIRPHRPREDVLKAFAIFSTRPNINDWGYIRDLRAWIRVNGHLKTGGRSIFRWLAKEYAIHLFGLGLWAPPWTNYDLPSWVKKKLVEGFERLRENRMTIAITRAQRIMPVFEDAKPGDYICRLEEGSVPIVLRRHNDGYLFVGEVFHPPDAKRRPAKMTSAWMFTEPARALKIGQEVLREKIRERAYEDFHEVKLY